MDVTVDRTFTDSEYPDSGTGYLLPITFTAGPQHMDGTRALEFARSRHAPGIEGSDFARSQRQQKIIEAFKAKVLSLNLFSNIGTLNSLLSTFADHFHTNLTPADILHVYNLVRQKDIKDFISLSLDPTTNLICPDIMPDTGAYILAPCPGKTAADVQNFFKNVFVTGKITEEKSTVWVNGSGAQNVITQLQNAGVTAYAFAYKGPAPSQTIFYQVDPKPATAEFIKNTFNATEVSLPPPGMAVSSSTADIIVILGSGNLNYSN